MQTRRQFIINAAILAGAIGIGHIDLSGTAESEYLLVANIPGFKLTVYRDGNLAKSYDICVGKPTTPTPLGEYKILTKTDWGKQFLGTWMRFKSNPDKSGEEQGGWGIHGSLHREFLGHALSKGCIRMSAEDAEELKNRVPKGTPIRNIYDIMGIAEGLTPEESLVSVSSDIYSLVKNPEELLMGRLPLDEKFIDRGKLRGFLEEAERKKTAYIETVAEFYQRFIKPLPDNEVDPDLLEKNPEMRTYLDKMSMNKLVSFQVREVLS